MEKNDVSTCTMITGWTAKRVGDDVVPDLDIACGNPAAYVHDHGDDYCCQGCYDAMRDEDAELVADYSRLATGSGH